MREVARRYKRQQASSLDMSIETRLFDICNGKYATLSKLAQAMGISVSQVYRVRQGKRCINERFIIGAIKAFPERKLDDLFYIAARVEDGHRERE